jgi:preprotein translocase subunit SecG
MDSTLIVRIVGAVLIVVIVAVLIQRRRTRAK